MPSPSRRTWTRWLAIVIVGELVVGGLATFVPIVRPREDPAVRADAIVVLSGDHGERLASALDLLEAGVARTLVLAGEPDSLQAVEICEGNQRFTVVCLRPRPDSTDAEARETARVADIAGWRSLLVVTTTYHVNRARTYFDRCFAGTVSVVGATPPYGLEQTLRAVAHEWFGNLELVFVRRSC